MRNLVNAGFAVGLAIAAVGASSAIAAADLLAPGDTVDDFRLLDHLGKSHQLYYLSDTKAVVLIAQGNGCAANAATFPDVKQLRAKYAPQNVEFLMINSNLADRREQIVAAAQKEGIELPILMDETQLIGESLGLQRNGEVLVINPKGWKLAYRGNTQDTAAALDSVLSGTAVTTSRTEVSGCEIKMPERARRAAHAKIS